MGGIINTISSIWKIKELRDRIFIALCLLAVYRICAFITLPGINPTKLAELNTQTGGGILGLLNAFTGGAFAKASIMALGIMPYISASIVVQLMGIVLPYIQKLQKEGQSGQNKINQITRWLTVMICAVQAPAYLTNLKYILPPEAFLLSDVIFWPISIIILTTGTIFAMWLGERITEKGIGNGISILITVGIIAILPAALLQEYAAKIQESGGGGLMLLIEFVIWMIVISFCVLLSTAIRKVPVQYARRSTSGRREIVGARQYIPLKLNASGVMPIIFAQALMFVPITLSGFVKADWAQGMVQTFSNIWGLGYNIVFGLFIILFTYFYTAITVRTNQIADNMKQSNGFIPGIRPGSETSNFLDEIMSRITLPGAIFLALISVLPAMAYFSGVKQNFALFFGGTSLLIIVGVTLDTLQQINSYLLNRHYDGLLESGRVAKSKSRIA